MRHVLEQDGYGVTAAGSAREAWDIMAKQAPDLVISDIVLPDTDGFELCRAIKSDPSTKNIPVVLLTGLEEALDIVRGLQCGADNLITRPWQSEYLLHRVGCLLANTCLAEEEPSGPGIEISFGGQKHLIASDRVQILNLLLSTYDSLLTRNAELEKTRRDLADLNIELEEKVKHRTSNLLNEVQLRRKAESEARTSEIKYRTVVDNANVAFCIIQDGRLHLVNQSACQQSGYTPNELYNLHFLDIVHPDDRDMVNRCHRRVLAGDGAADSLIFRIRTRSGDIKWADASAAAVSWLAKPAVVCFLKDITERKQAEDMYQTLANNSAIGIYVVQDGKFCFANPRFQANTGYSFEELAQMRSLSIVNPDDRASVRENAVAMLKGDRSQPYEFRIIHKNGAEIWAMETITPIRYYGRPAALGNFMDISRRKKAEKALQQTVRELETFAYTAAHDLRAPLVTIQGFTGMLRADLSKYNMPRVEEDARLIETGVAKMQALLNKILEYGRAGRITRSAEAVPLKDIIEESRAEVAGQTGPAGARISLAEGFPALFVDRTAMVQVFNNLIQNSVQYRDPSRPLTIEIGHRQSDGEHVFFVRDNGAGVAPGQVDRVFEPFYRGSRESQGAGLGLDIVKKIVEAHSGRVWIESEAGRGTSVCFTLPQAERKE